MTLPDRLGRLPTQRVQRLISFQSPLFIRGTRRCAGKLVDEDVGIDVCP